MSLLTFTYLLLMASPSRALWGEKSWICLTSEQELSTLLGAWFLVPVGSGEEGRAVALGSTGVLVSFCPENIIPRKMVFLGHATSHGKGKQMKSNEAHNYIMKNNKMHFLICTTSDHMTLL